MIDKATANTHHQTKKITSQQLTQDLNGGRLVVVLILSVIALVNVPTVQPVKDFVHQTHLQRFAILKSLCVCFVLAVVVVGIVVLLCYQIMYIVYSY